MTATFRVLAVEDDADTVHLMRLMLRSFPLEVVQASTGAQAVAILQHEVPDLLLLDINLPDMRGWEILDRYKADTRLERLPVVVLTGYADPVHRLIGVFQPVAAYLCKPINAEELRQTVRHLLNLP